MNLESKKGKSGVQIGAENLARLEAYLDQLVNQGGKVPLTKDGRPNLSAIAVVCGFDRQVFYNNPRCKELIEEKVRVIGGTTETTDPSPKVAFDPKEKRIRELERQVANLIEQLRQAEERLAAAEPYQALYQHACETGRSLVP